MFTGISDIAIKVEVGENFWFSNLEHIDRIMRIIINLDKCSFIRRNFSSTHSMKSLTAVNRVVHISPAKLC